MVLPCLVLGWDFFVILPRIQTFIWKLLSIIWHPPKLGRGIHWLILYDLFQLSRWCNCTCYLRIGRGCIWLMIFDRSCWMVAIIWVSNSFILASTIILGGVKELLLHRHAQNICTGVYALKRKGRLCRASFRILGESCVVHIQNLLVCMFRWLSKRCWLHLNVWMFISSFLRSIGSVFIS